MPTAAARRARRARPRLRHRVDGPLAGCPRFPVRSTGSWSTATPSCSPSLPTAPRSSHSTAPGHHRDPPAGRHPACAARAGSRPGSDRVRAARHDDRYGAGPLRRDRRRRALPGTHRAQRHRTRRPRAARPLRPAGGRGVQRPPAAQRRGAPPARSRCGRPRRGRVRRAGPRGPRATEPMAARSRSAGLQQQWLAGWLRAACEQDPRLAAEAAVYARRRLAESAAGVLRVTVHHQDVLVRP